jgi:signal transduction histidine kinase
MNNVEQEKARLMVVDDDAMVLQTVSTIFEMYGFEVMSCKNSHEALARLEQGQPDVLLTDIRMPGMSGTDLLSHLKNSGFGFPVIVMTGYADLDAAINAVKGGAFDFVKKPYDPEHLVQTVNRAVKHHRLLALERQYLAQLEREVQAKTEEIERASRLKTEFLNNISHEIRTPVNGIVGMISLASYTEDRDERQGFLKQAESSAMQLIRVVSDLVTLSGMMTHSIAPVFAAADLRKLIVQVQQRLSELYHLDSRRFAVGVAPELPQRLVLESALLEMALFHLVENGVKYAPQSVIRCTLSYDADQSVVQVAVEDDGPGMTDEQLQQVSELFVQGDGSNTRPRGGLGIGLNIVSKIAAFLNGRLELASKPGTGTRAVLTVPAERPS